MSWNQDSEQLYELDQIDVENGSKGVYRIFISELDKDGLEHLWCTCLLPYISGAQKKLAPSISNLLNHRLKEYLRVLRREYSADWGRASKSIQSKQKKAQAAVSKKDIYYEYDIPRLRVNLERPIETFEEEAKERFPVEDDVNPEDAANDEVEGEAGEFESSSIAEDAKLMETTISSSLKWRNRAQEYMLDVDDISVPSIKNVLVPAYEIFSETTIHLLYHRNVAVTFSMSLQNFRNRLSYIRSSYPRFRQLIGMLVEQRRGSIDSSAIRVINASLSDDSAVHLAHSDLNPLERAITAYLISLYTENCSEDRRKDRLVALRDYPQQAIFRSQKELAYRKFIQPARRIGSYRVKVHTYIIL